MLTLKTKDIPTLEIELLSGEQIHVLPATKRIIDSMAGFDPKSRNTGEMYKLLAVILSHNRENLRGWYGTIRYRDESREAGRRLRADLHL